MRTIEEILNKIKELKNIKKDTDLAELLGVKSNTITTWRTRKNVPYDALFHFCESNQIDLPWLVTGRITTKYVDVEGKRVLVMSSKPGLYKLEEMPPILSMSDAIESYGDFVFIPQVAGRLSNG